MPKRSWHFPNRQLSSIMLFRVALMTLASTAYGIQMGQMETAARSVISHLEAAQGHSLLSSFRDKDHLISRRQESIEDECPEAEQMARANAAFMTWNATCGTFTETLFGGDSLNTNAGANAICTNTCLDPMLQIFSEVAPGLPSNTRGCREVKAMMTMMPRLISGVVCARNHLNWRCSAVLGSLSTIGNEAVAGSGAGSGALEGSGAAPATLYGITLTPQQRSQFHGICGQMQAAGCCTSSLISVFTNPEFRTLTGDGEVFNAAEYESGIAQIKSMCTSLGRPSNYIGNPACRIASVRGGGIAAGTIPIARRVARLALTFPGDLDTMSNAFKARIISTVTTELNAILGDGAVTGVVLSSGSVIATASFADDITAAEVDAAASSTAVTELAVQADDGSTITPDAVTVTAETESNSAASAVAPGILAVVAAAATAGCML
jgi:hypothetical protein